MNSEEICLNKKITLKLFLLFCFYLVSFAFDAKVCFPFQQHCFICVFYSMAMDIIIISTYKCIFLLLCPVVVVVVSVLCFIQSCLSALFCFKTLFMCSVFLLINIPDFMQKKIITTLKKPNSGEVRNWFSNQQFCQKKKKKIGLHCRLAILQEKKNR